MGFLDLERFVETIDSYYSSSEESSASEDERDDTYLRQDRHTGHKYARTADEVTDSSRRDRPNTGSTDQVSTTILNLRPNYKLMRVILKTLWNLINSPMAPTDGNYRRQLSDYLKAMEIKSNPEEYEGPMLSDIASDDKVLHFYYNLLIEE